jgi:hypothetical protein
MALCLETQGLKPFSGVVGWGACPSLVAANDRSCLESEAVELPAVLPIAEIVQPNAFQAFFENPEERYSSLPPILLLRL